MNVSHNHHRFRRRLLQLIPFCVIYIISSSSESAGKKGAGCMVTNIIVFRVCNPAPCIRYITRSEPTIYLSFLYIAILTTYRHSVTQPIFKKNTPVSHQWCDLFHRLLHSYTRHTERGSRGERDIVPSTQDFRPRTCSLRQTRVSG